MIKGNKVGTVNQTALRGLGRKGLLEARKRKSNVEATSTEGFWWQVLQVEEAANAKASSEEVCCGWGMVSCGEWSNLQR